VGKKEKKTKVIENDPNPKWDEHHSFSVEDDNEILQITVYVSKRI
jgi:Ca2+-dependent lipid-binding protein